MTGGAPSSRIERAEAALSAIKAIESAGGSAHYYSVDLTDSDAVTAVMSEILASHDRIDVLMHAAGVEISHMLSDKPREDPSKAQIEATGTFQGAKGLDQLLLQQSSNARPRVLWVPRLPTFSVWIGISR